MRTTSVLCFAILGLLACGPIAIAQEVVYHPGDTVKVSVAFGGPDASKITSVGGYMKIVSTPADDKQAAFTHDSNSRSGKLIGPDTYEVDFPISGNQASGEYRLEEIEATLTVSQGGRIGFSYTKFPPVTFRIENPTEVKQPTLKGVTLLPK